MTVRKIVLVYKDKTKREFEFNTNKEAQKAWNDLFPIRKDTDLDMIEYYKRIDGIFVKKIVCYIKSGLLKFL